MSRSNKRRSDVDIADFVSAFKRFYGWSIDYRILAVVVDQAVPVSVVGPLMVGPSEWFGLDGRPNAFDVGTALAGMWLGSSIIPVGKHASDLVLAIAGVASWYRLYERGETEYADKVLESFRSQAIRTRSSGGGSADTPNVRANATALVIASAALAGIDVRESLQSILVPRVGQYVHVESVLDALEASGVPLSSSMWQRRRRS